MGKASRDKGYRTEANIVREMQDAGFAAERIPLSGGAGGRWAGDVIMPMNGKDRVWEVKCRADGFKFLYDSLADHYGLVVKADRQRALAVLPLDLFLKLARRAEDNRPPVNCGTNKEIPY